MGESCRPRKALFLGADFSTIIATMNLPFLVKDINDTAEFGTSSYPIHLTAFDDTLLFSAYDQSSGRELWKSDGTSAGTVLVSDMRPGFNGTFPMDLTPVGSTLYFDAHDGSAGRELWKSDGTA